MLELGSRLTLGDPVSAVVSLLFKSMVLFCFVDENNYNYSCCFGRFAFVRFSGFVDEVVPKCRSFRFCLLWSFCFVDEVILQWFCFD